jgi:hypothetical protein
MANGVQLALVIMICLVALHIPHAACFASLMLDQNCPSNNPRCARPSRWNVPFSQAKLGLKEMMKDGIKWSTTLERTALRFLYVKHVYVIDDILYTAEGRKGLFSVLVLPQRKNIPHWAARAQARLFRLLHSEACFASDILPSDVMSYSTFVRCIPAWEEPDSYVAFADASWRWMMQIRQRVHESKESCLSYMHAPVVLQSYLISFSFRNAENFKACEMMDMRMYLLEQFESREMRRHIMDTEGSSSIEYLDHILQVPNILMTSNTERISDSSLKQYGPVLVFEFRVYEDFLLTGRFSYLEKPSGKLIGCHAMVLVGVRREGAQKVFLLQSWWRGKQFIEVSETYLKACQGKFAIVKSPQNGVRSGLESVYKKYAESSDLDKMESLRRTY